MEADRILSYKRKDLDLFYKNQYGDFIELSEAWDSKVEEIVKGIFKRKKMRYFITFVETLKTQDKLTPSANKLLRFFSLHMGYGNKVSGYSMRDIQIATGLNMRYVITGLKTLYANDMVRVVHVKNRRVYMVNPTAMYKGNIKSLFNCVKTYNAIPMEALDGGEQWKGEDFG